MADHPSLPNPWTGEPPTRFVLSPEIDEQMFNAICELPLFLRDPRPEYLASCQPSKPLKRLGDLFMSKILATGLVIAVTAIGIASCAKANDLNLTIQHRPMVWDWGVHPMVQHVPQPTTEAGIRAQAEEDAKWVAYCRPLPTVDDLGVTRLTYAKRGCEFGRSSD